MLIVGLRCPSEPKRERDESENPRIDLSRSPHLNHLRTRNPKWFSPSLACSFKQEIPISGLRDKRLRYNWENTEIRCKQSAKGIKLKEISQKKIL